MTGKPWDARIANILIRPLENSRVNPNHLTSLGLLLGLSAWVTYGLGRNCKCANCTLHSGFEATAVSDMFTHPLKALRVDLYGPRINGPMPQDLVMNGADPTSEAGVGMVKETCSTSKV